MAVVAGDLGYRCAMHCGRRHGVGPAPTQAELPTPGRPPERGWGGRQGKPRGGPRESGGLLEEVRRMQLRGRKVLAARGDPMPGVNVNQLGLVVEPHARELPETLGHLRIGLARAGSRLTAVAVLQDQYIDLRHAEHGEDIPQVG